MKLVHYSGAAVRAVHSVDQATRANAKPQGLWLSCDGFSDNWRAWCVAESFCLSNLTHVYDVTLDRSADILRLRSAKDIDAFTERYRDKQGDRWAYRAIRWSKVAAKHQGIIIAPYVWERRLTDHANWYYGWDCASGCVWSAAAVASIELRKPTFEKFQQQREAA